jgi:hypothetical protein
VSRPGAVLLRLLPTIVVAYLVFTAIRTYGLDRYLVPSSSMEPTLHGDPDDGDLVLVDKTAYWSRRPEPMELAVVRLREPGGDQFLVKRVVALGPCLLHIDGGDLFLRRPDDLTLRRVVKDPLAARALRQTWDEFPARSPDAGFLLPRDGWRVDGAELRLAPGGARTEDLVQVASPEQRAQRWRAAEPDLHLPGHLSTRESITMSFLDCHGQRRGRAFEDQDAGFAATIVPAAGTTGLHLVFEHERQYQSIEWRRGRCRRWVGGAPAGDERPAPELVADQPLRIEFGHLDGALFLVVDDRLVLHEPIELQPDPFDEELPARILPRLQTLLHLGCAGAPVRVQRLRIFHDVYYDRPRAPLGPEPAPIEVPVDQLYLLGDNTAESRDSRSFGPIGVDRLIGRPVAVLAPLRRIRLLH